jgi:hypothetical protein
MKLWIIPPLIHHIFFRWLITIQPILFFLAGCAFTLALQAYLFLLALNISPNSSAKRYYTTDEDVMEAIFRKRGIMRS